MNRLIIFLFILLPFTIAAQKKWTLQECMEYAVANSHQKAVRELQTSVYHQNYLETIGNLIPSLSAGTGVNFSFGRGVDDETNTYVDVNSFYNSYSLNTYLTLFDGLANITRVKYQKINKLIGKQQLQQTEEEVAFKTMQAFINVVYYKGFVDFTSQQLNESREMLRQIRRMEELGMMGFPDVAEIEAKEAADSYKLIQAENELKIGLIRLKENMNYPINEDLDIEEGINDVLIAKSPETALDIYYDALSYLPEALIAETSYKASELAYKISKGSFFPTLSMNAGYSSSFFRYMDGSEYAPFRDQFKNKASQYIGFNLSIPLFNGFSRTANVKRSRAQMRISYHEKEQTLRTIYSEIEQAVADKNGQVEEYYQAKKQAEASRIAHEVNSRKYQEGLISAIELTTSANRLLQAQVTELHSLLQFRLKYKLVEYYKGQPFISGF